MRTFALLTLVALAACQPRYAGDFAGGMATQMPPYPYPAYGTPPLWQTPDPQDYGLGLRPPGGGMQTCMPSQLGGSMLGGAYCF